MKPFRTKSIAELRAQAAGPKLARHLRSKDLVFLGIGAVIGAGIFSNLGNAAAHAGPALVVSFALLGVVCALCGLCYAELSALLPVAGSAYTYAFATLGELAAWILGWDLILEYAIGNVAVAIAWSGYFQAILESASHLLFGAEPGGFRIELPYWLGHAYGDVMQQTSSAAAGMRESWAMLDLGKAAASAQDLLALHMKVGEVPHALGIPVLVNLPAVGIVLLITWLLVRGVRESASVNNAMVWLKLGILALFVLYGAFHVDPANWTPFAPNDWTGIHKGAAVVFFAYIGFDAVSTAAEETVDPQRDMPRGILGALAICTVVYIVVGIVATGLVPYTELKGEAPLANALAGTRDGAVPTVTLVLVRLALALGAVISMSAVLLVFQLGQPRIFWAMARDGLLPKAFAKVHVKYHTPHVTTIVTGLAVAGGAMVMDDDFTYDLTSLGTLFAFLVACIAVLVLRVREPDVPRAFRVPFVWVTAPLGAVACVVTMIGLSAAAWMAFGIWLAAGLVIYVLMAVTRKRA